MKIRINFNRLIIIFLLAEMSLGLFSSLKAQDLTKLNDSIPVSVHGSIGTNLSFYNVNGIEDRQDPFSYGITANATLSVYNISMPFSFTWFNNKTNINQPFNQFGVSPTYKWITCHLGYRSLNFSEFTLNGQTFLGAGVEMTPGNFRFGAIYGKFNKNSEYDPYMADSLPDYTRKGWALKIGYGTEENFVDFSMLRIGDNTDNYIVPNDSVLVPTPEQNMVYGITSKISPVKNLIFEIDGSLSFYTDDRKAQRMSTIEDTWFGFSNHFMTINQTSEYFTALKSSLLYKFTSKISTGIEYRRIAPGYKSMGTYFFNNDVENFTVNQNFSFLKDKVTVKGKLGLQRDNLDNTKKVRSKRTVGSLNMSYNINQNFGVDANYSNFTTNQKAGRVAIIDSLKLFQTNQAFSITPRYMKVTESKSHVVLLNYNFTALDDKNKTTQDQTETKTKIIFLNYIIGFIPQKLTLNMGLNYIGLKNNLYKNTMSGCSAGISKTLAEDKIMLTWNNSFMLNQVNDDKGTIFNSSLTTSYQLTKKQSINLNIFYIRNSFGEKAATPSYNEYRGDFSYVYTF